MSDLEKIITNVNQALPNYGQGIMRPSEMTLTRRANCFGRLATIGSALLENGLSDRSLSLLISRSHSREFKPGRYWIGHVALVVDIEDGAVVDDFGAAFKRSLKAVTWPGARTNDGQVGVVDLVKVAKMTSGDWGSNPSLAALYGTREVYDMQPLFTAHPFAEGIDRYQLEHPDLRESPRIQVADYASFYGSISQTSPSSSPSAHQILPVGDGTRTTL